MWSVVSASELPVQERFDWFSDTLSREVVPTALSTARPAEFQAEAAVLDLGGLRTATLGFSPLDSRRTPALIRRGDPGQYQLGLMRCGTASLAQQRNECEVGPGDILIWDTSRPSDVRTASEDGLVRLAMLQLPREAIPLPTDRLAQLLARRIPGHEGVAAVLTTFVNALENHGGQCSREHCVNWAPRPSISSPHASPSTWPRRTTCPRKSARGHCSSGSTPSSTTISPIRS
ncbi:cupin domain-containing protein [Streptomyces virginiae]|uniref:cupin domain-containing protein n=1 Tax=Streptomyces virginiae TaxID=1961 RepID=UPI00345CE51A